ncbi:MAG: peptidylprolyl isomerase [Clostridiales bacterium]|nr:peptidylprolyl isomerase [Clostridiales bacterium]
MKKFTIEMEDGGVMRGEIYEDIAPKTAENFEKLANEKFYDGLIFHRVIPGFMIQGGCPDGTGMGGPGHCIQGEFKANGFENNLKHNRGVLSMARAMDPNSAGSQFFIMTADSPHLDGQYAAFGKVTSGMEVADTIVSSERNMMDKPLKDQKINSIRVE